MEREWKQENVGSWMLRIEIAICHMNTYLPLSLHLSHCTCCIAHQIGSSDKPYLLRRLLLDPTNQRRPPEAVISPLLRQESTAQWFSRTASWNSTIRKCSATWLLQHLIKRDWFLAPGNREREFFSVASKIYIHPWVNRNYRHLIPERAGNNFFKRSILLFLPLQPHQTASSK